MTPTTSELIQTVIDYFDGDCRRIHHFLKVYAFARTIAAEEVRDEQTRLVIETAAVVHDVGIKPSEEKYHSAAGHYQELEGPFVARELMSSLGYDKVLIDRVCWLVAHHHHYNHIETIDHRVLVEADFLVNAYEDCLSRDAVESASAKIFATVTGKRLLANMYLNK